MKKILYLILRNLGVWAVISGPFILALFLTNPFNNVLYGGDDWAYVWSVKQLLFTGHLQVSGWASAAAVPQILWGFLFCRLFGFNFLILNLSTIVFAFAGIFVFFRLLIRLGIEKWTAVVTTIFLSTTPLYLGFAGTFMTDMFYTVLMLMSILLYLDALQQKLVLPALAGGLLASGAFLNRQIGLAVVLAFCLSAGCLWFQKSKNHRVIFLKMIGSGIFIPIITFLLYMFRPDLLGGRSLTQNTTLNLPAILANLQPKLVVHHLLFLWYYVAAFLFPLAVVLLWQARNEARIILRNKSRLVVFTWGCLVLAVIGLLLIVRKHSFFVRGDVFQVGGFYAKEYTIFETLIWIGLGFLSTIPAAVLIGWTIQRLKSFSFSNVEPDWLFLSLNLLIYMLLIISYVAFFNNYFLPILFLVAALLAKLVRPQTVAWPIAILMLIFSISLSVAAVEPQKSYVEASWQEAENLVAQGVDPRQVFVWPSWYGWWNYEYVISDVEKEISRGQGMDAFNVFRRMHNSANYVIRGELAYDSGSAFSVTSVDYRTLLGNKKLYIFSRCE